MVPIQALTVLILSLITDFGVAFLGSGKNFQNVMRKPMSLKAASETSTDSLRTFTSYNVYKGKASFAVKVIPPTFAKVGSHSRTVSREGAVLLEFAPIVPGKEREYDWAHKLSFSLSATECGQILAAEPKQLVEFFHDPNMKGDNAGQVTKKLRLQPTDQGNGIFVQLTVTDKSSGTAKVNTITVPTSWAEMEVVRSILSFAIPRLMAFDTIWNDNSISAPVDPIPHPVVPAYVSINPQSEPDFEESSGGAVDATKKTWGTKR